jgi:hypothetical protein
MPEAGQTMLPSDSSWADALEVESLSLRSEKYTYSTHPGYSNEYPKEPSKTVLDFMQ